ncbi:putative F-box/LRR-repeat protein at3g44810 [Phtheirospermum japonicum]|uniref:Putative F-box/LRR-repeat protein at3g44810 n=1 Tax=Phtheirospermum japonicum TaxID=374723 RepID=A0A830C684_9LAMI|nr:putative F-box/LRR-repeat protein at3g44810 [Phtheirospermum japonicum]
MDLPWTSHNPEFMSHFTQFVTQFLSRRNDTSTINKFGLTSNDMPTDSIFVEKCIDYAIDHGVRHLAIDTYCHPTPLRLPDGLFASHTLRALKVKQYTCSFAVPKPLIMPNLETLYLDSFEFKGGADNLYSFPKEPFSGFPNLEELTIHNCEVSGLIIRSARLRVLEISFQGPFFSREEKIEEISVPGLVSFRYKGYYSLICPKMDLPCLEDVYFDNFEHFEAPYTDDIKKKMPINLVRMLQQLGNANPTPFPYIKCLKLKRQRRYLNDPVMDTVSPTLMNYLTEGCAIGDSVVVKF